MSNGHARLGPSNNRWPNCPGSVREEANYEDVPGAAAIDGTGSHLLLEMCFENNCRAEVYDMQVIGANHPDSPNGWLVDQERVERVQECLDYVQRRTKELREQFNGCTVKVESESKANPGSMFGRDDWWGTVDITITVTNKHDHCMFMEVIDYKDGRGYVKETGNTQLTAYLAGKMARFIAAKTTINWIDRVGGCRMTIVQPKTNPSVRYEEPTPEMVVNRASLLAQAAELTDDPNAPLIPDDKGGKGYCRWCKHKPNCTATSSAGIEAVKFMTTETNTPLFSQLENAVADINVLTNEQLADIADTEASVQAIYDKVKGEIQRRVDQGDHVPGYAMQPGRGTRTWNCSDDDIVKMLKARRLKKDQIYPAKLITPAQVLKLECLDDKQKERIEKEYITFVSGKNKLTKVSRETQQQVSAQELFANIPDQVNLPEAVPNADMMFLNIPE